MPEVPNMAGRVLTVKGPIDPDEIGLTLMHEHLLFEGLGSRSFAPKHDTPASKAAEWYEPMTLKNLYRVRADERSRLDNCKLTDVEMSIAEVSDFRDWGGSTIVDVTNHGIRRDPHGLYKISQASGLNVVMGSSWYVEASYPDNMEHRTVNDLADEIVMDITVGVGSQRIRSGIIGEVGVAGDPLTPGQMKVVRASARASRITGAPISFHWGGTGKEKLEVAASVAEEGADLSRTIFGHSDIMAHDMDLMLEVLDLGAYIQFDLLGRVGVPLSWGPLNPDKPWVGYKSTSHTALVAFAIPRLIDAGYLDRILLSQDVCTKVQLKSYGGTGYAFIPEIFLPHLEKIGVTEDQIRAMVFDNPKRVLTFVEPNP